MGVKIQFRHDTAANWASVNPLLMVGEGGFEYDTMKQKIGNGVDLWNTLPYANIGNQGTQGFQGVQGSQGFQGLTGPQGFQGNQGVIGNTGLQGVQGSQGFQGNQGFQGTQGTQGNQGNTGLQGPQGFQGNQGVIGNTGLQGTQGVQGTQGNQGNQGNQGFQGTQGTQGNQGNQGFQGTQGNQGNQGNQGTQGTSVTGPQGSQGNQGNQGALNGLAYYVSGSVLTVANTTTQTSLVPGITAFAVAAQNLGNVINLELDGTITFDSLYNYVTWQWKLGNTVIATFTSIGTDMAAAVVGTAYPWTFNGRIVPQAANGASVSVALIGQLQVFIPNDTVSVSVNTIGTVNTTIQNTFNVLVQWNTAAVNNSFVLTDVAVTQSTSTLAALVGPAGPVWTPSSSPTFTYTSGLLTRVDYASDSSYKVLTYTGSVLTQVDYVKGGVTTRKVLNYTTGVLTSITQTVF